jgi:signal transduction histidine kinase
MTSRFQRTQLWWRVGTPFLLFVISGSVGLIIFFQTTYKRQSYREFEQLAKANADFIRTSHLPATDRFADYLTRVVGVAVYFQKAPPLRPGQESVTVNIEPGTDLILVRDKPSLLRYLFRPVSLSILLAFWTLSLALAWAITRGIVRPYLETQRKLVEAERLALLGKMAAALAHEIQNPVAAIRLHAQLAGSAVIVNEAAAIESLVNQWMFLAKPEPPQTSRLDLAELLSDAVRALAPTAGHAQVRIVLKADSETYVQADARRLGQAVRNLIINAIQAMPAGGTLTITATGATITFADTGAGFSPEALRRAGQMFYSEREGGMGIGLSVVREIVQAHGGKLAIANQPAGGACVTIQL